MCDYSVLLVIYKDEVPSTGLVVVCSVTKSNAAMSIVSPTFVDMCMSAGWISGMKIAGRNLFYIT